MQPKVDANETGKQKGRVVLGYRLRDLGIALTGMAIFWLVFVGIVVGTAPY